MRIAFVTLGFAPVRSSGLDVSGERLVAALLDAGHEVTVIAGAPTPVTETHEHERLTIQRTVVGASNWIGYGLRAARLLSRLRADSSFDVVHFWDVHFAYAYGGRYVASLHQSFRQRLAYSDYQQTWRPSQVLRVPYYRLARALTEEPALRRAAGLLAVSNTTREEFIEHYRVPPERIAVARHGIDTDLLRPSPEAAQLRTHLGIRPGETVLLFVGFVTPRKGLDYLAAAMHLIEPTPRLLIVGRWSRVYRDRFRALLGSAAARVMECGFVPEEEMPAYYSMADILVSPSLLEGFGLPLIEALACGTPVVATDAGAIAEVVGPGGVLVPPRDPAALARAVSELMRDERRREELARQGRAHVLSSFTIENMLRDTIMAYTRFLRAPHAGS